MLTRRRSSKRSCDIKVRLDVMMSKSRWSLMAKSKRAKRSNSTAISVWSCNSVIVLRRRTTAGDHESDGRCGDTHAGSNASRRHAQFDHSDPDEVPVVFIDQYGARGETPDKRGETWPLRKLLAPRTSRSDDAPQLIKVKHVTLTRSTKSCCAMHDWS